VPVVLPREDQHRCNKRRHLHHLVAFPQRFEKPARYKRRKEADARVDVRAHTGRHHPVRVVRQHLPEYHIPTHECHADGWVLSDLVRGDGKKKKKKTRRSGDQRDRHQKRRRHSRRKPRWKSPLRRGKGPRAPIPPARRLTLRETPWRAGAPATTLAG
jgi:hypothetical protein